MAAAPAWVRAEPQTCCQTKTDQAWEGDARRVRRQVLASAVAAALLAGCAEVAPSGSAAEPTRIVAHDDGYMHPDTLSAGLAHILFENSGSDIHELMFVRLSNGMTPDDYLDAVRSGTAFPEGAVDYSGPGLTSPGETVRLWLQLDSGTYLLACWFRGHLLEKPPHVITVSPGTTEVAAPPEADAVLRLYDYRFEPEGRLSIGSQTLRIETHGPSLHEADFFRLDEGRTVEDLREWHRNGKRGPAPARAVGGVLDYHDISRSVWLRMNLRPGRYVVWCGMDMVPDTDGAAGDPTHADAGMFMEFELIE